jgi:hypothetical protein
MGMWNRAERQQARRRALVVCFIICLLGFQNVSAQGSADATAEIVDIADVPLVTALPGHIEAENYAAGGEGVGYHDTTPGNTGGQYRADDVDIQRCVDAASQPSCYNVGWVRRGEWLAYTVDVADATSFVITARVATPYARRFFHLEVDGHRVTDALVVPRTGDYQAWQDLVTPAVAFSAGEHELRIVSDTGSFNVNYLDVTDAAVTPPADSMRVAAAGDIACDPTSAYFHDGDGDATHCRQMDTSDLLVNGAYDAVFALGDNQYDDATLAAFDAAYDPSWGRVKDITHPAAGNHEYQTPHAADYYAYFGAAAGDPKLGYYSYDLGAWHIVVLNSNCFAIGGCTASSPQGQWLAQDLATHANVCTLAYMHHPRYSSGEHGDNAFMQPLWDELYVGAVDVVLAGHDHDYERFAPMDADGQRDDAHGIRSFVVGTGGKSTYGFEAIRANSEAHNDAVFGVLALTLMDDGYSWDFQPVAGQSYSDSGTDSCH